MKKMMLLAACLAAVLCFSLLVPHHTRGMQKDGHPFGASDDLVFIHHSCGQNWLSDGLHSALLAKTYVDERNDISYGTDIPPDTGRPDSLAPAPGDRTDMDHWIRWFNDYLGGVHTHGCADGVNHIIMFKSCYPISNIVANGTEPGDPFSGTQTIANYKAVYRHPNGTGHTYTHGGYTYQPLEDIFVAHPDILFIPVTAPPRHYAPSDATNDAEAHRARVFNTWLKQDWLTGYNAAHPDLDNVAVFDWFDLLAYPDNHTSHPNRLRAAYGGESGNSHPNTAANQNSTQIFATNPGSFIDTAWNVFNTSNSTPPAITDITASPDPQDEGSPVNISCTVTDPDGVQDVYLHVTGPDGYDRNMSITGNVTGSTYYCNTTYPYPGTYTYAIWANDTLGYSNSSTGHGFTITANTYYVATSGSDSNPGTITHPWATIQHALDTATAGDTIMVRGGTYNEYLGTNTSGIPGYPITLQGYPGETAVLNGSGLNWRYGIDIGGADHLVIQNLTITDYIRNGLRGFGFVSWYGSTNITLRNLEFSLVGTPVKFNRGGTDIHLDNITAHTYDSAGFDCGPNGPGINIAIRNVTFFGPGNGTNTAVDGFAVEYGSNVTVEDCLAAGHPGDGFDFKSGNTTLRRCIARNNSRNNIKLWGDNSSLINCLSSNSGLVNLVLETGGSYTITNCLFASRDTYGYLAEMGYSTGPTTPITVYNTIFYNDDPDMAGTTLYLGGNVTLTADHNLYFNPYRENDVIDVAFLGRTFSHHDINDGTWHNLSGCGHNSSYANPLFTNASTDDYHLTAASPAVDAGTSLMAPSVDLDHHSRPQGAAYDIGPYERLAGAPSIVYVDDDFNASTPGWQTDHFAVIQDGIGAVAVNGTVHVANGTYQENVVVNKTVDLTGEHRDGTVVDGGGNGDVVTITANGVNISGFIVQYGGQEGIYLYRAHNCSIKNVEAYGNGDVGVLVERGRDNLIVDSRMHNNSYDGVLLEYANYTFVTGITCSWNGIGTNGEGILLLHSRFCIIANNTCHANGESGIIVEPSSCNNTIANNTCSGNADAGIVVSTHSNDNIIAHNILYNNTYDGLLVETSSGTNITANTIFHNGEDGVYLLSANTTLVHANTIYNNTQHGIYLDASFLIRITNNSVHHHIGDVLGDDIGKGICLYYSHDNTLAHNLVNFNDEVGINLIGSSNNILRANTANNNYDDGIFLYISSYNTLVNNSACNNSGEAVYGSDGIVLYGTTSVFSEDNTVEHNTVNDNDAHGLQLRYASNNSLHHNMVCNNGWGGVSIWTDSHNNTLACTCLQHNNGSSIYLGESSYNMLMNNAINGSEYGIYLDTSQYNTIAYSTVVNADLIGINLANSSYNLIKNTTSENNSYGIYFYAASRRNEVAHTVIAGNTDSGVYLGSQANYNILYNNYFNNSCNAWDAGNNTWNITKTPGTNIIGGQYLGGNYWSDYPGIDTDGDHLGDTYLPYNNSGNIQTGGDYHPLVEPNYAPVAGFTVESTGLTTADIVYFNSTSNDSDGSIVNWTWQMGDGTTLYGENVCHRYDDDGSYNVSLTVTDDDGVINSTGQMVNISNVSPTAGFMFEPMAPSTADMVYFNSTSTDSDGSLVNWTWQMGDGITLHGRNVTHIYGDDGSYTVTLVTTDDDGATDTISHIVNVSNVAPSAGFTFKPTSPNTTEIIYFNSTSSDLDGSIVNWTWSMGDGTMLYGEQVTHSYADDGTYTVNLTVTDNDGATASNSQQISIDNVPPVANDDFASTDEDTTVWIDVLANDSDSDGVLNMSSLTVAGIPSHGGIVVNASTGMIRYIPDTDFHGIDSFTYTVDDDDGAPSNAAMVAVTVHDVNDPPLADFTMDPSSPSTTDVISFNSTSSDLDGSIVNRTWSMGDGAMSYGEQTTYSYADDGSYNVTLTVTDDDGGTDTASQTIGVSNAPPTASFVIEPCYQTVSELVFFNCTSSDLDGSIVNRTWSMGDGTMLYGEQVTHSYADTGTYMVQLTVMDDDGATDVMTRQAVVVSIDRIAIVFESQNEIADGNLSTNCSFSCHAAAFNSTYGFVEFVDASWSLSTTNATASINTTQGRSVMFSSGDTDGTAVLTADAGNGHVDAVFWAIDGGLYTAYLSRGWNLVTVPVANTYTAASLGQNLSGCSIVARWNASAGMFQSFVVGVTPGDGFAVEDGTGYFVYMDCDGVFSMADVPISQVSVALYQGWNTLGWYNDTATNASSLGGAVGNCTIVACWNASSGTFASYLVGVSPPSAAFRVERGMGVFVYVTKPGVWHGGG